MRAEQLPVVAELESEEAEVGVVDFWRIRESAAPIVATASVTQSVSLPGEASLDASASVGVGAAPGGGADAAYRMSTSNKSLKHKYSCKCTICNHSTICLQLLYFSSGHLGISYLKRCASLGLMPSLNFALPPT
ncbi:unnamed protein product [Microthlaspi erraticum]|uniref:Uncharacterized protein n=1 Tax=Microthlaspi erraticum TaxID=1685480 RepID=A0A6D2KVM4_9BRAS|nr:unnamed protein product [Microthlaspi erraticum]